MLVRLVNVPSALYELLGIFATASPPYNLTLLHYDAVAGEFGDYVFWLDVAGNGEAPRLQECLDKIGRLRQVKEVFCLGSCPATTNL